MENSKRKIGFFDVDSLQSGIAAAGEVAPLFKGLRFRERMQPIAGSLNELYAVVHERKHPFVFCTCCSGKFIQPGERSDTLYIPVDATQGEWRKQVSNAKLVYLEKITMSDPAKSYELSCFNVFKHNPNAHEYFKAAPVDHWIVFGNGFELCISSAIKGVIESGKKVWLIKDTIIQSAKGYGSCGTPEGRESTFQELRELGVKLLSLEEFKEWYQGQ